MVKLTGGAASTLVSFLDSNNDGLEPTELINLLTKLTISVLNDTSDPSFIAALQKSGWDETNSCFSSGPNIEALRISLRKIAERRGNKLSTLRASQVGVRNTIKSFAPDMLMIYTIEKGFHTGAAELAPFSVFFDGVVLLADISGFTRLSGKFCDDGRNGIDQLQQTTNNYLGELVKNIYAYGGDVMKFAGDALVCVFRPSKYAVGGRESTLPDVCSNAVQCATELAQICRDQLTIHVAISCGSICFAMLGGQNNIWESLISGECIGHLSQCLEDAGSKETVVSKEFVNKLGLNYCKELIIEPLSSGNYRVISAAKMNSLVIRKMIKKRGEMLMKDSEARFALFPNDDQFLNAISLFVPIPVNVGLMSGSFDYLAELREVTTMFMSWDSYCEVENKDLLSLQKYFIVAQKVLHQSGGFMRQFLIDDKGCVLIACWGVPTASHPDNTRKALCAGANIAYELNKLGQKTSVGITTGNVFCGSVGSYVRREYAVIGDVVNLAARLMSKADGGLYTDEATHTRLPRHLQKHLEILEPMAVKGKDKPITPYRLKRNMQISLDDDGESDSITKAIRTVCKTPLVGGMEIIASTLVPVNLKFIVIEGKEGAGKMEVVDWLKLTGPKMDIRIVSLLMTSKDFSSDYYMIAQLFRLLVTEDVFDDISSQQIVVRHILREIYKSDKETAEESIFQQFDDLLYDNETNITTDINHTKVAYPAMRIAMGVTCSFSDTKTATRKGKRLPPRIINECLKDIFCYLFNEQPVVVVVEHAHFSDYLSWNVLLNLVNVTSRALLVITMVPMKELVVAKQHLVLAPLTSREDTITSDDQTISFKRLSLAYERLTHFKTTTLVLMNDYSIVDVDQLLCSVLGVSFCPEGVANMVHQLSGGNPFWCREMAVFIKVTGAEEFMRAMNPGEYQGTENMTPFSNSSTGYGTPRFQTPRRSFTKSHRAAKSFSRDSPTTQITASSNIIPTMLKAGNSSPTAYIRKQSKEKSMFSKANNEKFSRRTPESPTNGDQLPNVSTTAKLELFIVCRFEKLSSEDQNVLRTASIIGHEFSRDVLYGILSPRLRTQMFNSLFSLVKNQWVTDLNIDSLAEYSFVHPLLYQTLYDLTPAGDKARLHYAVAMFIEESYEGNATHYAQLGYHYGLAKDCGSKALEYYVRAAVYSMSNGPLFYDEGLRLLDKAIAFSESAMDYGAILGIVMDRKDKLSNKRKELIEEEKKAMLPQAMKTPPRRYFANFKTVPLPTSMDSTEDDSEFKNCNLTVKGTDTYLDLFADMEDNLENSYKRVVDENNVGTTQIWQIPYLIKRKELQSKMFMKNEIRKGVDVTFNKNNQRSSQRGSRMSLLFGESNNDMLNEVNHPFDQNSPNVVLVSSKMNQNVCKIS